MIFAHDQWQNGNVQKMCEIGTYPQYREEVESLLRKRIGNVNPEFNRDGSWSHDVPVDEAYVQRRMNEYDALWKTYEKKPTNFVEKKESQIARIKKSHETELRSHEEELDSLKKTHKVPKKKRK